MSEPNQNEAAREQAVSRVWLRLHATDFQPCEANANILGSKMQELGLPWTLENLEIAFSQVKDQLSPVSRSQAELEAEDAAIQAKAEADAKAAIEAEALASLPGHGMAIPQFTTPAEMYALPKDVFRKFYHSNYYGPVFRARIEEVFKRSGKSIAGSRHGVSF